MKKPITNTETFTAGTVGGVAVTRTIKTAQDHSASYKWGVMRNVDVGRWHGEAWCKSAKDAEFICKALGAHAVAKLA